MNWRITQTDREAGVVMLTCPALDWDSFPRSEEHTSELQSQR